MIHEGWMFPSKKKENVFIMVKYLKHTIFYLNHLKIHNLVA